MPKTITLRIENDIYKMLKTAANGAKRSISNFIEYATISYLTGEIYVSDKEMDEILHDRTLLKSLKQAEKDISKGKFRIV